MRYIQAPDVFDWLYKRTVYVVLAGSRCQGLDTSGSDYDVKGIFLPPSGYFYSPFWVFEQASPSQEALRSWCGAPETVKVEGFLWSITKFVYLAVDGNPQMLEVLFVDDKYVLECHPLFRCLLDCRDSFLGENLREKFLGYGKKSLRKLRRHKSWFTNPPTVKPTREHYGILGLKMPKDKIQECRRVNEEDPSALPEAIQDFLKREKKYQEDKREWDAYQEWLDSRNLDKIVEGKNFGYDPKDAANAVRYLRMASEVLEGRGFIVERSSDREEILALKRGQLVYDQVVSCIETEIERLESLQCQGLFPRYPDVERISTVLSEVIRDYLGVNP
jgi:hypothetical protein